MKKMMAILMICVIYAIASFAQTPATTQTSAQLDRQAVWTETHTVIR